MDWWVRIFSAQRGCCSRIAQMVRFHAISLQCGHWFGAASQSRVHLRAQFGGLLDYVFFARLAGIGAHVGQQCRFDRGRDREVVHYGFVNDRQIGRWQTQLLRLIERQPRMRQHSDCGRVVKKLRDISFRFAPLPKRAERFWHLARCRRMAASSVYRVCTRLLPRRSSISVVPEHSFSCRAHR